eukprot:EG_transcript_1606
MPKMPENDPRLSDCEIQYLRKHRMAQMIDESLKDMLLVMPPNPWRFLADVFQKYALELEQTPTDMPHLESFGLVPGLDVQLEVSNDEGGSPIYIILGPAEFLASLKRAGLGNRGKLTARNGLTLEGEEKRVNHIPEDAEFYCFMYPLDGLTRSNAKDLFVANRPSPEFPGILWSAFCYGGFLYFGGDNKFLVANGLTEGHGLSFDDPLRLGPDYVAEMERNKLWHDLPVECLSGAVAFAWIPEFNAGKLRNSCFTHGGFAFQMQDGSCWWYGLSEMDLTFMEAVVRIDESSASVRRKGQANEAEMRNCVDLAAGFAMGYPVTNLKTGQRYSLQNRVPYEIRLATAFFAMIGRNESDKTNLVKSGAGHWEFSPVEKECIGLPTVRLVHPLSDLKRDIVFNANVAEEWLRKWFGGDVITQKLQEANARSVQDIFGDGEMFISRQRLQRLNATYTVRLAPAFPVAFYKALVKVLAVDPNVQYFWENKAVTLQELHKRPAEEASNPQAQKQFIRLMDAVAESKELFGFRSAAQFRDIVEQSMTELSTTVVIAGEVVFLSGNHGQITPLIPTQPNILLVSTAGVDFDEPDRTASAQREEGKYFVITKRLPDGSVEGDWKSEYARAQFKQRIRLTYDMIFQTCQEHGVTHLSLIPMGLGIFLPRIQADDVKLIYFDAQLELLGEHDYGFHTVFINPGPAKRQVEYLLRTNRYKFSCNVMIHSKNGKYLVQQLARAGYPAAVLNPSDCIAMLQGRMGYWWEVGRGSRYVGEEDIAATSTAPLMQYNATDLYTSDRIKQHKPRPSRK